MPRVIEANLHDTLTLLRLLKFLTRSSYPNFSHNTLISNPILSTMFIQRILIGLVPLKKQNERTKLNIVNLMSLNSKIHQITQLIYSNLIS